jgi:hypothetical protein
MWVDYDCVDSTLLCLATVFFHYKMKKGKHFKEEQVERKKTNKSYKTKSALFTL